MLPTPSPPSEPLAIQRLIDGPRDPRAVDAFLAAHRFPLPQGPSTTFVWRGIAQSVSLRHFIFGLPSSMPLQRIDGTDLWYCVVQLPYGSRLEYKFEVEQDGRRDWVRDPLNPASASDPFGANSVCQAWGYAVPDWVAADPEARPGHVHDVVIPHTAFGAPRRVTLYLPARYRKTRRYPLLLVHDGGDYLRFSALKTVLDNLIYRGEVQPLIAALTHPGDRLVEYPDHAPHVAFMADELLPWLERRLPVYGNPAHRCLMGASFGAVASLSVAWRRPGTFGRLLLQSGSFAFTDIGENKRGPAFEPVVKFVNAFRANPGRFSERLFVSCGTYETLIYENRSMVPLLQQTGMQVKYVEARDGHNWENWRDRLREGLSYLFPGSLWMVYE